MLLILLYTPNKLMTDNQEVEGSWSWSCSNEVMISCLVLDMGQLSESIDQLGRGTYMSMVSEYITTRLECHTNIYVRCAYTGEWGAQAVEDHWT